ncbi:MAG: hypothetical protein ACOCP4_01590 [Candidatus Woesearchaeota archaeon]
MYIVKNVEIQEVDEKNGVGVFFHFPKEEKVIPTYDPKFEYYNMVSDKSVEREIIHPLTISLPDGRRINIGWSKNVEDVLGVPLRLLNELSNENIELKQQDKYKRLYDKLEYQYEALDRENESLSNSKEKLEREYEALHDTTQNILRFYEELDEKIKYASLWQRIKYLFTGRL